jgi:hypothetical protein
MMHTFIRISVNTSCIGSVTVSLTGLDDAHGPTQEHAKQEHTRIIVKRYLGYAQGMTFYIAYSQEVIGMCTRYDIFRYLLWSSSAYDMHEI